MNQQDLYLKQIELEEHMSNAGLERYQRQAQREREHQRGYNTKSGKMLLHAVLEPATQYLTEWLETPVRGRPHVSITFLKQIKPELAVFIASRLLIDAVMTQDRLISVCERIGSQVEDEIKYAHFLANGKLRDGSDVGPYWKRVHEDIKSKRLQDYDLIKRQLDVALDLHDITWSAWSERERLRVGEKLVDVISNSTDLVQVLNLRNGRKSSLVVHPGPGITEMIGEYDLRMGLLAPVHLPCLIPPKPWTKPFGGGYHGQRIRRLTLVKTRSRSYLDDLGGVEMPAVYKSINALQDTAWSVNPSVLEVVQDLKEHGFGCAGLPDREDLEIPPYPDKSHPDFERVEKEWRRDARQIHEFNAVNLSKRLGTERIVNVAEDFMEYEEFYFPYQLDFRGRVYPVASDLQPQGCDLSRGLLQFSEAKAIEHPEQARWLAIHGANCFGVDKVSMEERVDWVEEHEELILGVATDPLDTRWWQEADKPFQFLAWCFDWAGLLSDGYGYESKLPIQMDGTCNGLQIFSLLLRDAVGGQGVNLVPCEDPQDIYQQVADETTEILRKVLRESPASDEGVWAERWLQLGVDRKLCKRPVMTLPYGVTRFSIRSFVFDVVKERSEGSKETIFGTHPETREACNWMGDQIWEAIGRVVIAAREAMDWLQSLARLANDHTKPVSWMTPSGLPIIQSYRKHRSKRLDLHIGESMHRARISEVTSTLDKKRQANGIAPNYVHSLDGAALALTICHALDYGVTSFSMVHDSYGTHAADSPVLADSLREVFVEMFDGKDLLGDLQQSIQDSVPGVDLDLPPRPAFGDLVVSEVLESEYFFA